MRQLHGDLKCPEHHSESLLLSTKVPLRTTMIMSFVQSKNFKTPEEMTKILKDTTDPMVTYKTLLKIYQDYFVKTMQKGLATLRKGGYFKIDNHTMSCPVKFM